MRFLKAHPQLTLAGMDAAQTYNFQRYHYQGIGRYEPAQAYQRGLADLRVLSHLIGEAGSLFGASPTSTDAGVYGSSPTSITMTSRRRYARLLRRSQTSSATARQFVPR